MAFVSNMNNDEEQKTNQNTTPQGPVSPTGSGGGAVRLAPSSAVPAGGGGTAGAPSAGASPKAGGQFASLNQYIDANQGQATPLAGQLTSSIGKQYNNLDTQNNAAISNINNQVTSAPGYTQSNPDVLNAEAANPVSFSSDPNNVKQFQSLLNNTYSGPASAEGTSDYANQQSAINNAIATGQNNTTTEAGRENLLSQNETTPTTGVTALNSAILSQDPNALKSVQNAYVPFNNLLTNLSSGAQGINTTIGKEQADAASSSAAANAAIANQVGALNTGVQGNIDKANAANTDFTNNYNSLLATLSGTDNSGRKLSDQQAIELGLTPQQAADLYTQQQLAATPVYETGHNFGAQSQGTAIDNSGYLTPENVPVAPTANQVATPQQFQNLMALMSLNNGQVPTGALLDPAQAAQAGTYTAPPSLAGTFDYNNALANATNIEQQERADAQSQADILTAQADAAHAASKKSGVVNAIKDVINRPGSYIAPLYNPVAAYQMAQDAYKHPGTAGPNGINPLPNRKEKDKLGVK